MIRVGIRIITIAIVLSVTVTCTGDAEKKRQIAEHLERATQAYARQDLKQAETIYRDILGLDSRNVPARIMLGKIAFYENRFGDAEAEFEKALIDAPDHSQARTLLARVKLMKKDQDAALTLLDSVLEESDNLDAMILKGMILEERKDYPAAIAMYRAVEAKEPTIALAHMQLGRLYQTMDFKSMAEKQFERARVLNPRVTK